MSYVALNEADIPDDYFVDQLELIAARIQSYGRTGLVARPATSSPASACAMRPLSQPRSDRGTDRQRRLRSRPDVVRDARPHRVPGEAKAHPCPASHAQGHALGLDPIAQAR